jgi:transcriptional regulator with XRE-family HTH domain
MKRSRERITLENDRRISIIYFRNPRQRDPSLRFMKQIADALDIFLSEFLEETGQDSKSLEALADSKPREIAQNYECTP